MYDSLRACYESLMELSRVVLSIGFFCLLFVAFGMALFFAYRYAKASLALVQLIQENEELKTTARSYCSASEEATEDM